MSIVIFSKDRPFQLSECLRSLIKYEVNGCKSQDVYVLVKLTETERERYERVEKSFPSVRFVKEGESFEKDLQGILKECSNAKTIMFTVDDAFFYRNFSLSECANLLERRKDVYSVHLKLSSRIDYCHPAQKNVKIPTLHKDSTFMIFDRSEGSMDWNYPWDLAGSVYRTWSKLSLYLENISGYITQITRISDVYHKKKLLEPPTLEYQLANCVTRTQVHQTYSKCFAC